MTKQVQIRGAVQATQEARVLAVRELDSNTTDKRLVYHDGSTVGGIPHPNWMDIQNQEYTYAAATGTNSIAITLAKAPAAYAAGQFFEFKAQNTITGSATLNVNSLGAKTIKRVSEAGAVALVAGDIVAGGIYSCRYDGTDMLLLNPSAALSPLELVEALDITTPQATADFPSVFEAGYCYEIVVENFTPGTDNRELIMRFTQDNGSSYLAGSTDYGNPGSTNNGLQLSNGLGVGAASGEDISAKVLITNPYLSGKETKVTYQFSLEDASGTTQAGAAGGRCRITTAANTGFRLLFGSGNINSGRVAIYKRAMS